MTQPVRFSQKEIIKKYIVDTNKKNKESAINFIKKRIEENKNLSDSQKRIIELVKSIS